MKNNFKIGGKTIGLVILSVIVLSFSFFMITRGASAMMQALETYDGGGGGGGTTTSAPATTPTKVPVVTTRTQCSGTTLNTYTTTDGVEVLSGSAVNNASCGYVKPGTSGQLYNASSWPAAGSTVTLQWCTNGATASYQSVCNGSTQEMWTVTAAHTDTNCTTSGEALPMVSLKNKRMVASAGVAILPDTAPSGYKYAPEVCTTVQVPESRTLAASNPNSVNCPIACTSAANVCGDTAVGTRSGGTCSAGIPAVNPLKYPKYGQTCTVSNSCGSSATGKWDCHGVFCDAIAPANPAGYGSACTSAANVCGMTNAGTKDCNGVCNASKPSDSACTRCEPSNACGQSSSGYLVNGVCSVTAPPDTSCTSCTKSNSCGDKSSTGIMINGVCNAVQPAERLGFGQSCTSTANSCGKTNSGTKDCNGTCSATQPSDSICTTCRSPSNACGGFTTGITLANGTCSVTTAPSVDLSTNPKYGQTCTAKNSCGISATGTFLCGNIGCSESAPSESTCWPTGSCTSNANSCGQSTQGKYVNGVCNAVQPANPNGYGASCQSTPNTCGQTNSGINGCYGCSATQPSDAMCATCRGPSNACGGFTTGIKKADGSCTVTTAPAVDLSANPKYGQACTATNSCGVSASGTYLCANIGCSASAPSTPAGYGQSCTSSANSCGQTSSGVGKCDGTCSGTTPPPPPIVVCASAANNCGTTNSGTINCSGACSAVKPADSLIKDSPCTSAANACGMTNSGTKNCAGVCSAVTPSDGLCTCGGTKPANYGNACTSVANSCGAKNSGTIVCDGTCSASKPANPANYGNACTSSPNVCGTTSSGTIQCNGACSAVTPTPTVYGQACTSAANSCGVTSSGTYRCDGTCTASKPSDSSCTTCSPANKCGDSVSGIIVNGTCTVSAPPERLGYGNACNPTPNKCGMFDTGTIKCDGTCSVTAKIPDIMCPGPCTSAANSCGDTKAGNMIGGVCDAIKPAERPVFIATGLCVIPPPAPINGVCSTTSVDGCDAGFSQNSSENTTFNFWTCKGINTGAKDAACSLKKVFAPTPVVTVNPATNTVIAGQNTTFTWTATNSTYCERYKDSSLAASNIGNSGTFVLGPQTVNTVYEIRCMNMTGSTPYPVSGATHTVTVNPVPLPVITITPTNSNITSGQTATFSWNVTGATSCNKYKDGTDEGVVPFVRSFTTPVLTYDTTYDIRCVNSVGIQAIKSHKVFVAAIPPSDPKLVIIEQPISYSTIPFGEYHTQRLVLMNQGDLTLKGKITISNDQGSVFTIRETSKDFNLSKGSTATFNITFTPKNYGSSKNAMVNKIRNTAASLLALAGPVKIYSSAVIVITSNDPAGTQNVSIDGTGVDNVSGQANLQAGDVPQGVSRTFNYRVDNNALTSVTACLKINSGNVFKIGTSLTAEKTINARAQELFNIVFSPLAISTYTDVLSVGVRQLDGSCKSMYDVNLSGNGVKPVSNFKEL